MNSFEVNGRVRVVSFALAFGVFSLLDILVLLRVSVWLDLQASRHYLASYAKCAQSRSNRNTSLAGGSGACVSIQRTGSAPAFSKL